MIFESQTSAQQISGCWSKFHAGGFREQLHERNFTMHHEIGCGVINKICDRANSAIARLTSENRQHETGQQTRKKRIYCVARWRMCMRTFETFANCAFRSVQKAKLFSLGRGCIGATHADSCSIIGDDHWPPTAAPLLAMTAWSNDANWPLEYAR
jgi:hypothetical protein